MDVFSRSPIAYPTSSQDTKTTDEVKINKMTKHKILPTTIISINGLAFVSHVIKEVVDVLDITPQERTHDWLECVLDHTCHSNKH